MKFGMLWWLVLDVHSCPHLCGEDIKAVRLQHLPALTHHQDGPDFPCKKTCTGGSDLRVQRKAVSPWCLRRMLAETLCLNRNTNECKIYISICLFVFPLDY